jgi:cytochrome c biogenesis protein
MRRIAAWLSDLRVAIVLLFLIAISSAVGTAIPQGDAPRSYVEAYATRPWIGLLHGEQVLQLQLDHVYSSVWFLSLLAWLGLALILCSWRRQWPALHDDGSTTAPPVSSANSQLPKVCPVPIQHQHFRPFHQS